MHGIEWPAISEAGGPGLLPRIVAQLEQTQWWSADELARHQRAQLAHVVKHAATTVPHYEASLRGRDLSAWASLPILTRTQIVEAGPRLLSRQYPATHGTPEVVATSRTSGEPVRTRTTGVTTLFWKAITLRDHAWHGRDLHAGLASIRFTGADAPPPDGAHARGWGPATAAIAPDAPLSLLSVASSTAEQVAWLVREAPAYLLIYPTVLDALLRELERTGTKLPSLRQVRTVSEALSVDTRARCREVLGVPLVDAYSAQEVGYLALQCPDHAHYHVQAERLIVEILDDDGRPCAPGEIGRVVVTDLHNFATPIVRYEIGDYAEVGAPCPCGRGLPVLNRIVGRRRGMLTYPDGRTSWPLFAVPCRQAARYRECQLVQDTVDALRLRVVPDGPVDEAALVAALHACLGHPFDVTIEVVDAIGRSPAGKLEEFVSRVVALS